jgi:hypothetical protein
MLTVTARRQGKELSPAFPVDFPDRRQPQVKLVHQGRRLERVAVAFLAEQDRRHPVQLRIHQSSQFLERIRISIAPADEPGSERRERFR